MNRISLNRIGTALLVALALLGGFRAAAAEKNDRTAILLVAFGTTVPEAARAYANIERVVREENPGLEVYWAYTSNQVRNILKKRGEKALSVPEALARMHEDGVARVALQSLHIVPGLEYHKKILANVAAFQHSSDAFEGIAVGKPMLFSRQDLENFCHALLSVLPEERRPEDAVLLMGHNNDHGNTDCFYIAAGLSLNAIDENVFVATVEGSPDFETAAEAIRRNGADRVYLMPLMVVAGDHARNDLAGDEEDSWKSLLLAEGVESVPVVKGLGEYDVFAGIYAAHLREVLEELRAE